MTITNREKLMEGKWEMAIQKIYLKDASFETKIIPETSYENWPPEVDLHLNNSNILLEENVYEVVLGVRVTAKLNNNIIFIVELYMAGIFIMKIKSEKDLQETLGFFCPEIIFPYAREAVADLVAKGGFPQLNLSPVNFEQIYTESVLENARSKDEILQ